MFILFISYILSHGILHLEQNGNRAVDIFYLERFYEVMSMSYLTVFEPFVQMAISLHFPQNAGTNPIESHFTIISNTERVSVTLAITLCPSSLLSSA